MSDTPETDAPEKCPNCGATRNYSGQPSARWHYDCGSYAYEGTVGLAYISHMCAAQQECDEARAELAKWENALAFVVAQKKMKEKIK